MRINFEFNGKSLDDVLQQNPKAVGLNVNRSSSDQSIFTEQKEELNKWLEQTGHDPGFYKGGSIFEESIVHMNPKATEENKNKIDEFCNKIEKGE